MNLTKPIHLPDVNILLALLSKNHMHHNIVFAWFNTSGLRWALCAFTEAGFLRNATSPRLDGISVAEATFLLRELAQGSRYRYLPIEDDWHTLCSPFFPRLHGTKQITDAYLLGLAVRNGMVLVTLDKGLTHLAGDLYRGNLLLLEAK